VPLALGAAFLGVLGADAFASASDGVFWRGTIKVLAGHEGDLPELVSLIPLLAAFGGAMMAGWFYLHRPDVPRKIAQKLGPLHHAVSNKYYFDELYDMLFVGVLRRFAMMMRRKRASFDQIYDFLFVRVIQRMGKILWEQGDDALIDRLGADGVAAVSRFIGRAAQRVQTGYLYHYALAMVAGLALCVSWALFKG
jgi:NADH-quinone oxidoreductase subunit L